MLTRWRRPAAIAVLGSAITAAVLLGAYFGPIFYTESHGQPLPYLWAAVRLELTGSDLEAVGSDQTLLMQKCCPAPLHRPLSEWLAGQGWTFQDQMGAGLFYEKGMTRLTVTSRMFSRRYVIYKLSLLQKP